ncbi:MAG: ABC transporter ATP-binding protein [Clostridia bacterium]|nr:ABC transporter ATP-binding protein [Clostridia bacterium]
MRPTTKSVRKPQNAKKTLKRILSYLDAYKGRLPVVAISIIISSTAGVAGTYLLKPLLNNYIVPFIGQQSPDYSGFIRLILVLVLIYASGALCSVLYSRMMVDISKGALAKIRKDLFSHMQKLPIRFFDTHTHGELMSCYSNDIDALREMLSQAIPQFFSCLLSFTGVFVMMIVLSPYLTILAVLMLCLMLLVVKKIGAKSAGFFRAQQKSIGALNGYVEEMVEGQKVVQVFGHEDKVKKDFVALNEELCTSATNAHTFANILMPIMGNLSYLHYALTAVLGAILALQGLSDVGTIASFLQYTRSFAQPLTQMSQLFNSILSAMAGAERIFAVIDEPIEADNGDVVLEKKDGEWVWCVPGKETTYVPVRGDVRFHDVTFGYVPEKMVLHHVSLYAKPGQKIAFVGSTGAGKTTITNLINRFYDIEEGTITYDGIPIQRICKEDLRRSMSMVLQDTHLFTGTVADNIRYGRLDATDEEVIAAAKIANAHTFIMHLEKGYDTELSADGGNLSQGQRQLLSIARAAVADPPVLILDEATSSIDTRTEKLIEKGMDKLMEGRTVFVIAHRLSTVRNADAIMVLENGNIIERGDHDDLIKSRGKYYQLYTGMFELE